MALSAAIRRVVIVLPFYNEEALLEAACQSLGFGASRVAPIDTTLVLVDNASTDRSSIVAKTICNRFDGTVRIVYEAQRGYVPARSAGVLEAASLCELEGWSRITTLIVQADADTTYGPSYAQSLRNAATSAGRNHMLVGRSMRPASFHKRLPKLAKLYAASDAALSDVLSGEDENDVIVDDKVAAFRLADYDQWGGHLREEWGDGREMLAETTRLYMRARVTGARRVQCSEATATHSARRLEREPVCQFIAAGFPGREVLPDRIQALGQLTAQDVEAVLDQLTAEIIESLIVLRRKNLVAEFGILPRHVGQALLDGVATGSNPAPLLPRRTREELFASPAQFIEDAFAATHDPRFDLEAWVHGEEFNRQHSNVVWA